MNERGKAERNERDGGRLSVVIPAYNAEETLCMCVEAVMAAEDPDMEVIVVDAGSTDSTASIVHELTKSSALPLRLVSSTERCGPAKARNLGARAAEGRLLFFLDSDTEVLPNAFCHFRRHIAKVEAVTGCYHYEPLNPGMAPLYKAMLNYYFFARGSGQPLDVFGASVAGVRRDVFFELGGFNETLEWGMDYENEEFGYLLTQKHTNILVAEVCARHRFPGMGKMLRTYFGRVAQWMELFCRRRRFDGGANTSADVGGATASLLLGGMLLPLGFFFPWFFAVSLVLFVLYLAGYRKFFMFVIRRRPAFFPAVLAINMVASLTIAAGASLGLLRVLTGRSRVILRASD